MVTGTKTFALQNLGRISAVQLKLARDSQNEKAQGLSACSGHLRNNFLYAVRNEVKAHSIKELSFKCNVSPDTIRTIAEGKANLKLATLVKVARGVGYHPSDLLSY